MAKQRGRGRPPIVGNFTADVGTSPTLYKEIRAHWARERKQKLNFDKRILFLEDIIDNLDDHLNEEEMEHYRVKGRPYLRQKFLRAWVKDQPKMKLCMQLCNRYDQLMFGDDPDVKAAVSLLGQIGKAIDSTEKAYLESYSQQVKMAMAAAKIELELAKRGEDPENTAPEEAITIEAEIVAMREQGVEENLIQSIVSDRDAYNRAVADVGTRKEWEETHGQG